MIHGILNPKVIWTDSISESIKEQYLKVFKYFPSPQKVSYSHKTPLLLIIISFVARGYRHRAEVRVGTMYHLDRQHIAHIGYEIWSFVLVFSTLLDGCQLNQEVYLNLVFLEKSRTFEELGTESPRISDLPASKDIWEWQFPNIFSVKSDKYEIYTNDKLKPVLKNGLFLSPNLFSFSKCKAVFLWILAKKKKKEKPKTKKP